MESSRLIYYIFRSFVLPCHMKVDMGGRKEMLPVLEKMLVREQGRPAHSERDEVEAAVAAPFQVTVVFTSADATLAALRRAGILANRLGTRVALVVAQIVPYPLPLNSPPVLLDFSEQQCRAIASATKAETSVHLYLCRDLLETLMVVLKPNSLVVVGSRRRWWPTREKFLARKLGRAGHEVIFTETE
jgi:hypothetical protein